MRTHLSQREYSALQTLFAMVSGFEVCVGLLEKRSAEAGCAEEMRQVSAMAQGCMDKILRTVPENKLMHIHADLGNIRLMSHDDVLKNLIEITEYFVQCHVNAAPGSEAARKFAGYIIALDKARYAVRRLQESEAEEDDGK